MRRKRWLCLLAMAGLWPLLGVGCSMQMRDAVQAGVFDFVSGSVTNALASLFPVPGA